MSYISLNTLKNRVIKTLLIILTFSIVISCNKEDSKVDNDIIVDIVATVELPKRSGSRPETTMGIPHIQIGVELVSEVNEELFRRVLSLPGIEIRPSVVGGWQGLWLTDELTVIEPDAIIEGREFAHIHDDGSLHIFLQPARSKEAVENCWAIYHPYALQERDKWLGFVMLYTPQSMEELNVTFQLIVDGYNYVTGQKLLATNYY